MSICRINLLKLSSYTTLPPRHHTKLDFVYSGMCALSQPTNHPPPTLLVGTLQYACPRKWIQFTLFMLKEFLTLCIISRCTYIFLCARKIFIHRMKELQWWYGVRFDVVLQRFNISYIYNWGGALFDVAHITTNIYTCHSLVGARWWHPNPIPKYKVNFISSL